MCLARVACVKLPGGHWPELIALLMENIVGEESTEAIKMACLESIGYILYYIKDPLILEPECGHIYTSIMSSLWEKEQR